MAEYQIQDDTNVFLYPCKMDAGNIKFFDPNGQEDTNKKDGIIFYNPSPSNDNMFYECKITKNTDNITYDAEFKIKNSNNTMQWTKLKLEGLWGGRSSWGGHYGFFKTGTTWEQLCDKVEKSKYRNSQWIFGYNKWEMNFVYPNLVIDYYQNKNILTFPGFQINNVGNSNIIINFEDIEKILTDNVKEKDWYLKEELQNITPKIKEAYAKWNPQPNYTWLWICLGVIFVIGLCILLIYIYLM